MNILLLNPPFLPRFSRFSRSPAVTRSGTIYFPIWHAYAAGLLEKHGHKVKLVDAPADSLSRDDCYRIAEQFHPGLISVFTSTPSIYNDMEIAGELKALLPSSYVTVSGPHVTALPEESLKLDDRVDAVTRGEYDFTLVHLASSISSGTPLSDVWGLTLREDGGGFAATKDRPLSGNLDEIPFVSRVYKEHLNIRNYFYAHCRFPVVSIFASRGCPARCTFCQYPEIMWGRNYRQRTPGNVVDEFEYITKDLPFVREVLIDDDTFSFHVNHTEEFCRIMIDRKIKLPWTVECRANLPYDTMRWMKRAGCRLIVAGFESANDDILLNMRKGVTHNRMREFVKDAERAGVMIHACFMAGNPGETKETLEESLAFAKEINADTCQFFPLMVYPGTPAYAWAEEKGFLATKDFRRWLTPEGLHNTLINTPELSADDLTAFCDRARREFYLGPRYLRKKLLRVLFHPQEFLKTLKSARTFARHLFRRSSPGRAR